MVSTDDERLRTLGYGPRDSALELRVYRQGCREVLYAPLFGSFLSHLDISTIDYSDANSLERFCKACEPNGTRPHAAADPIAAVIEGSPVNVDHGEDCTSEDSLGEPATQFIVVAAAGGDQYPIPFHKYRGTLRNILGTCPCKQNY